MCAGATAGSGYNLGGSVCGLDPIKPVKIASWNVNSLKVRLPHVLDWLAQSQADVLALQETKLTDDKFPVADIQAAGYHVNYAGQKTYNGVAIISRQRGEDVVFRCRQSR